MTNSEKFLKNPDDYHDLACEIAIHMSNSIKKGTVQNIDDFFKKQVKPILSEDEKVILKHKPLNHFYIGKDELGIYTSEKEDREGSYCYWSFTNAFNNIAKGEEYKISDLLEE